MVIVVGFWIVINVRRKFMFRFFLERSSMRVAFEKLLCVRTSL